MTIPDIFNNLFKVEIFDLSNRLKLLTKHIKKEISLEEKEKQLLLFRLNDTKNKLNVVENAFEQELIFDLIEAHIHEINSLNAEYSHLIKQAKHLQITNNYELEEEF